MLVSGGRNKCVFHTLIFVILVVKKSNVIQLHVDSGSEHGVGPKQSRSNGGKETVYLGSKPGMTPEHQESCIDIMK